MADVSIFNVLGENINIKDNYKKIISTKQFNITTQSTAEEFKNAISYCVENDKILFIENGEYNLTGIGNIILCNLLADNATIILGDENLMYNKPTRIEGINFIATPNTNGIIRWESTQGAAELHIKNCSFKGNGTGVGIRNLTNKSSIVNCSFTDLDTAIIQSNTTFIESEQYIYSNLAITRCTTGIDIEGYINSAAAIGRLSNVYINNITHINASDSINAGVGHDCILISFVDNFVIDGVYCEYLGERAIYCNTCSNGSISNINAYNTGGVKVAGQNNSELNAFSHNIALSNLTNIININCGDQSLDIYDSQKINVNGFYFESSAENVGTNGFIRFRGQLDNIVVQNGTTIDGYRQAIGFEVAGITKINNVMLNNIKIKNPRIGPSGGIISSSLNANSVATNVIIDGVDIIYDNQLNILQVPFMNVNYFNNIMIKNCDMLLCLFPTVSNSQNTQFANNKYFGNERGGWNSGISLFTYNAGNIGASWSASPNMCSTCFPNYGNGVSLTTVTVDSTQTVPLPRGAGNCLYSVIGRNLNTVFWFQNGVATRVTGDTPTIRSGELQLTAGDYLIIGIGY